MHTDSGSTAMTPRRALLSLGAVGLVGAGLSVIYATTGIGLPCPFLMLTGWQCPLCGGTRVGAALLHGDLSTAWAMNPVVVVVAVLVSVRAVGWAVELARDPGASSGRRWLPEPLSRHGVWWAMGAAVCWTVLRNLV